jgi:4-hydroxybenzoate polyprenyltransferase
MLARDRTSAWLQGRMGSLAGPQGVWLLCSVLIGTAGLACAATLPPGVILPIMTVLLVLAAAGAALVAWLVSAPRRGAGLTHWDVAGLFAFLAAAAAIVGDPQEALRFLSP